MCSSPDPWWTYEAYAFYYKPLSAGIIGNVRRYLSVLETLIILGTTHFNPIHCISFKGADSRILINRFLELVFLRIAVKQNHLPI